MLQTGIVGLPNVGKSTLFNAVTKTRKAAAANYPFCTIEPNVGVVKVPDDRLKPLAEITQNDIVIPAAIEFKDIAGLVKGANKGEGLGTRFLAQIRECHALIQVVRCFEDDDIVHPMGSVDPIRDIEIINAELILADIASLERKRDKFIKLSRGNDKVARAGVELIDKLLPHLNEGKPANTWPVTHEEEAILHSFFLLSSKPTLFAANVAEEDLVDLEENPNLGHVEQYAERHLDSECMGLSARLESELGDLSGEEAKEFMAILGVENSGVSELIRTVYRLLGLVTFFTHNEEEVRAWTIPQNTKAPRAAGLIHTDFERGFIKAEVVSCHDLFAAGSGLAAREAGAYRLEGKDYAIRDGDVVLFRFNPGAS
ncbi:MAG: redox-regulated ATPase YchF [Opitutae bacterium]|nr:redox-regulated ATPase YchF [Opitutae bacterium]